MDWLEQNLDAYRIIAEILEDLRETLRQRLDQVHGQKWYEDGLPEGLLDRLVGRKEEEKAIDWYESEYQQIMNYALFPDLLEILEHNSELFPQIVGLAPTGTLLNARFLELEVMRAKLGRARPISETELSFLGTFHLRFRKAIEDHRVRQEAGDQPMPATPPQPSPEPPPESAAVKPPPVEPVKPPDPEPTPPPQPDPDSAAPSEHAATTAGDEATAASPPAAEVTPPPAAEVTAPPADEAPPVEAPSDEGAPATEDHPAETAEPATFEEALEAGDAQVILREMYKEVTNIAEGIWTKEIPPPARIWEKVSVSPWYENNFSNLGLRPVSDFYDVISKVDTKMRNGISKDELQSFLKEVNFAHVLLSLRDMFQKNHI